MSRRTEYALWVCLIGVLLLIGLAWWNTCYVRARYVVPAKMAGR